MSFIDSRYRDFQTFTSSGTGQNTTITENNLSGNQWKMPDTFTI
jgi:hypothetical protein